eukprot:g3280.t1
MAYTTQGQHVAQFSEHELEQYRVAFQQFDADGNGSIDENELNVVMQKVGVSMSRQRLDSMIREVDKDGNKTVEWNEFLDMMAAWKAQGGGGAGMAGVVVKAGKFFEVSGTHGTHSFSDDEKQAFTEHINQCLAGDPDLPMLPLDPASMGLFSAMSSGVLLCKLVNCAQPDTIDTRAINTRLRNVYQQVENCNLGLNACRAIGCVVVNIDSKDIIEAKPILILGLVWQIVKIQLMANITLTNHPELVRLLQDGETLEDFMRLPPDQILLRWFNYHLANAGHPNRVKNFSGDVKDSTAYSALLHQIAPQQCDKATEPDVTQRAAHIIANATRLGVESFIKPKDICSGNAKLNMAFVAQIFNTCPALDPIEEAQLKELVDFADEDVGDTREERVFRMWINSLNIEGVYVNNLFSDVKDGLVILKVMDRVQPGCVDWKRVNIGAKDRFRKVENCNYCVEVGKALGFSLVNVGGLDIVDGNKKLVLAIIWQLLRLYTLNLLAQLAGGGRQITEPEIVSWANGRVPQTQRCQTAMTSFQDKTLGTGLFLLDLCAAVEPRAVDWTCVLPGGTAEEKEANAKYVISVARKLGATVFLTYEDILEVKPKMLMTFVAAIMLADSQ